LARLISRIFVGAVGLLALASVAWSTAALADEPTTVTATLAVEPATDAPTVTVSADRNKAPVGQMMLGVYLGAIPSDATLTSCTLRLVTASQVPTTQYNGIRLELFDAAQDAKTAKSIAGRNLDAGAAAGSVLELSTAGLCRTLQKARANLKNAAATLTAVPPGPYLGLSPYPSIDQRMPPEPWCVDQRVEQGFLTANCFAQGGLVRVGSMLGPVDRCAPNSIVPAPDGKLACAMIPISSPTTAELRVQTTIAGAAVNFWGRGRAADSANLDKAPRLLLSYTWPNSYPGRADWSQPRHDPQQSGRSLWRVYNKDGAYTPDRFAVRQLGSMRLDAVSPPLLIYNRQLVAVSDNAKVRIMDADGTVRRTIDLPEKLKFMAVSQQGWLDAIAENSIMMQPLEGGPRFSIQLPNNEQETVLNPPTVGAGGNLYVVTSKFVYAYPPPPVPAALTNLPLWQHLTQTGSEKNNDVSAVALSEDGRTVYFIDKQHNALYALDAATGAEKWKSGLAISRAEGQPMPVPVVAGRNVFVANATPTAKELDVVNAADGKIAATISGGEITAPVIGPDKKAYYFRDDKLRRWPPDSEQQIDTAVNGACEKFEPNLLRADQSRNIYALDRGKGELALLGAGIEKCIAPGLIPQPNIVSLAVAPDGSMLGYSGDQKLVRIMPVTPGELPLSNEVLKLNQDRTELIENNDMTFRAGKITTSPGLLLPANSNINIVAANGVVFQPGLRIAAGARLHVEVGN
jgi:outer membrane protein assembly factor BamB